MALLPEAAFYPCGGHVERLTSSRSPEGDGIPRLAAWVSCFVHRCLPWFHSGLVLHNVHRLCLPAGPAVGSRVSQVCFELGYRCEQKNRRESSTVVNTLVLLPKGTIYLGTPETLLSCQGTVYRFFFTYAKTEIACGR